MNFDLTEEQSQMQEMARSFAADRLAPHALEWDESGVFPLDILRETGPLGFGGVYVREDFGGSGLSRLDGVLIFEQLSYADPAFATFLSIHNMCAWMVDSFGGDDQRQRWVPKLTSLDLVCSYCLTEPGSGSDAAALKTRAVKDGDDYVVSGSKAFITGGDVSDVYLLMCRTGGEGSFGISTLIVEDGISGLSFGANERKMGWRAQPTAQMNFDAARIPADHLLGDEGIGFKIAMAGLDGGRLNIAAGSLGAAQAALDRAMAYMRERHAFGKPLTSFQALQFTLADMETELQAARTFLYQAAWKLDQGHSDATKFCAMAKRLVTDTGFKVANQALQLHGGYGYLADYGIEKIVRDLRVHQIVEGTNEIMRVIVARQLLGDNAN